jgi:hypothetical protein
MNFFNKYFCLYNNEKNYDKKINKMNENNEKIKKN